MLPFAETGRRCPCRSAVQAFWLDISISIVECGIKHAGEPDAGLLQLLFHEGLVRIEVLGADRDATGWYVTRGPVHRAIARLGGL